MFIPPWLRLWQSWNGGAHSKAALTAHFKGVLRRRWNTAAMSGKLGVCIKLERLAQNKSRVRPDELYERVGRTASIESIKPVFEFPRV